MGFHSTSRTGLDVFKVLYCDTISQLCYHREDDDLLMNIFEVFKKDYLSSDGGMSLVVDHQKNRNLKKG